METMFIKTTDYPLFYYEWVTRDGHRILSCTLAGDSYTLKVML